MEVMTGEYILEGRNEDQHGEEEIEFEVVIAALGVLLEETYSRLPSTSSKTVHPLVCSSGLQDFPLCRRYELYVFDPALPRLPINLYTVTPYERPRHAPLRDIVQHDADGRI